MRITNLLISIFLLLTITGCSNYGGDDKEKANDSTALFQDYITAEWMDGYKEYVEDYIDTFTYRRFSICQIDEDDIPEICFFGNSFSDGAIILSQQDGMVFSYVSYWSPQYIEKSGLINDGYSHSGSSGDIIVKLENGSFKEVLNTEAIWYPSDNGDFYVYKINEKPIDTLSGNDINEESCQEIKNELQRVYHSQGKSILISDSPEGMYDTRCLFGRI